MLSERYARFLLDVKLILPTKLELCLMYITCLHSAHLFELTSKTIRWKVSLKRYVLILSTISLVHDFISSTRVLSHLRGMKMIYLVCSFAFTLLFPSLFVLTNNTYLCTPLSEPSVKNEMISTILHLRWTVCIFLNWFGSTWWFRLNKFEIRWRGSHFHIFIRFWHSHQKEKPRLLLKNFSTVLRNPWNYSWKPFQPKSHETF